MTILNSLEDYLLIQNLVKKVLRDYPETRNSQEELVLKVWDLQGLHLTEDQRRLFKKGCSKPESITRAGRHIQNDLRMYRPTAEVQEQRELINMKFTETVKKSY